MSFAQVQGPVVSGSQVMGGDSAQRVDQGTYQLMGELRRFHESETRVLFMRLLRALCYVIIAFELSLLLFFFDIVPNHLGAISTIVVWTIPLFAVLAVVTSRLHQRATAARDCILTKFTELGLKVDEAGRLCREANQASTLAKS